MTLKDTGSSIPFADYDPELLPAALVKRCYKLVDRYHRTYGYHFLPDILWTHGMGPLIEQNCELRKLLKTASTTRRVKLANEKFLQLMTAMLALEILVSGFARWDLIFPLAAARARHAVEPLSIRCAPLIQFYLDPLNQAGSILAKSDIFPNHLCSLQISAGTT
jgi:hypothetical protein